MVTKKKRKKRKAGKQSAQTVPMTGIDEHTVRKSPQQSSSGWQLRPNDGQGMYTGYFSSYVPRKVEADFYEFLRESIPVIDAAIQRLTELDGHLVVRGNNDALVEEIQEWMDSITVNDIQKGILSFDQCFTSEAHEQGFGVSEFVTNRQRNDIVGLRVADSKFIKFTRTQAGLEISQKGNDDNGYRVLKPDNLMYFSINNENQNPYGTSLMRSCEFVSKALVTIQNSVLNVWERFGDPSFSLIYKTSKRDGKDHAARRARLESDLKTAIMAKRAGKSGDFVYAIDKDSDVVIKVIGADNQVLEMEAPARHMTEQIVAKTGLPPWMLGLHWSTTERLSDAEANMLLASVKTRQAAKMPLYRNLVRNLLLLRGRTWKRGDWDIEWAQVNLHDILKQAQAGFLSAQAEMMRPDDKAVKSLSGTPEFEIKIKKGCACCGKYATGNRLAGNGVKELSRPVPWPELDEVEDNFERELKYDWSVLTAHIFTILKLPVDDLEAVPKPVPREEQLATVRSGARYPGLAVGKVPGDIPDIEAFVFSVEQRAAIMSELETFNGKYDWRAENSAVRWYYGQSYSLGLVQAARLIGKDRPILDIIKNREVFKKLVKTGFKLVKDNATKGIITEIIPEMEAQMIAGTNPRHVAKRLRERFGKTNSDWERLARTEMSVAAERAKIDEWKEWQTKKVTFVIAPDSCPVCISLEGEYDIGNAPVPGTDTHPRCRCTLAPR